MPVIGLVADIHTNGSASRKNEKRYRRLRAVHGVHLPDVLPYRDPPLRELPPERPSPAFAGLTLVVALLLGALSFNLVNENVVRPAELPSEDVYLFNVTKQLTLCNQWGISFYKNLPDVWGGVPDNFTNGQLTASRQVTKTGTTLTVIRAQLLAFNYTNMSPPSTFIEARLEVPLKWFYSSGIHGPIGRDLPHWESRNFTVSAYEVLGPWKTWSRYINDGATWTMVRDDVLKVDRTPIATVWNVTPEEYGFGDSTHGSIYLNMAEAIDDWRNGTWHPRNGLLLAMIAPWETTEYPWFSLSGLKQLGMGLMFPVAEVQLQIGVFAPIPEFSTVLVPVAFLIAMAIAVRRRGSRGSTT